MTPDESVVPLMGYGGALNAGASVEWFTPPEVFTGLGLRFDLDPCAPIGGVPWVPANRHFHRAQDGLSQPWDGRVWLNPPYGREAGVWVDRLADHGDGVALVFARVDTAWCQKAMSRSDAVCLIAGRLSFIPGHEQGGKGHNAAAPSMLMGFGPTCAAAVLRCGLGTCFVPGATEAEAA